MARVRKQPGEPLPPQDLTAEQAVLGSILIDADAITEISSLVQPADFYREAHAQIYRCALDLAAEAIQIDYLTLSRRLQEKAILEAVGGEAYLVQLIDAVPTAAHAAHYAGIVAGFAERRKAIAFAGDLASAAQGEEALDLAPFTSRWLDFSLRRLDTIMEPIAVEDFLNIDLSQQKPIIGQGLLPYGGRLVFAGAPKLGKSVLMLQLALELALGRPWLGIFPIERPWRVLYLDFEASIQVTQDRLRAMTQDDMPPENMLWICSMPPLDIQGTGYAELARQVRRVIPEVLIMDTISKIHLAEENSATAIGQVFSLIDRFRLEHHIAGWVGVHHDRKAAIGFMKTKGDIQNIRGSSAILGWPESLAIVEQDPTGGRRISLALRDQQSITEVLTEYNAETMLSSGGIITERDVTIPANQVIAILTHAGGRMLRQELIAQMEGAGIPLRSSARVLKYMRDKGQIEAVKSESPGADPRAKDYVLKEETVEF